MKEQELRQLLENIKSGTTPVDEAVEKLKLLNLDNLGFATIDHSRELRTGYPEVIYGEGKTADQIIKISSSLLNRKSNVLITRINPEKAAALCREIPEASYQENAKVIRIIKHEAKKAENPIALIAAGTSDLPVAEEAALTAEFFGSPVERFYDVGVAGIHRLLDKLPAIRKARAIIVCAGMEGALASVVGGLVDKPVIAVPTSVGYGANFQGLSALLAMLNSCANGVAVVNIDNGFGAGYMANLINQM